MLPTEHFGALAHPAVALTIGLFFFGGWLAKRVDYFLPIALAYLAFSVGISLQIVAFPSQPVVNALLTGAIYATALLCFYYGLVRAGGGSPSWLMLVAITLLFLGFRFLYTAHEFNSIKRIYALQIFMASIFLLACWNIRGLLRQGNGAERFMFLCVFFFGLSILPRTFLTVGTNSFRYGYDNTPYWTSTQITLNAFIVIFSLSLLLVYSSNRLRKVEQEAFLDPLTRLNNRSGFHSKVEALRARCESYSLIIIDIDKFKSVNDRYGHVIGDKVLATISRVILESIRETDEASRYGGEEFLVFLPECGIDEAYKIAERLRSNLEKKEMHDIVKGLYCTASLGVAEFSSEIATRTAYRYVDQLLYSAKGKGRNQVCHTEERISADSSLVFS